MSKLFLIDVDGVAADLVSHTLSKLSEKFDPATLPKREQLKGCPNLFRRGKTPLTRHQLAVSHQLLASPGFVQGLPFVDGVVEGIAAIRAAGHKIVWITAPWISSPTWDFDRRTWLRKNLKTDERDVGLIYHKDLVQGDIFIDDTPKYVKSWSAAHPSGRALLYTQPQNDGAEEALEPGEKPFERFNWKDTERLLKELT